MLVNTELKVIHCHAEVELDMAEMWTEGAQS